MATATLTQVQTIVRNLIEAYASYKPSNGEIETEAIIDQEKGHYEVMHVGWDGQRRIHGTVIHIDIIDDKVWIQHDGTSPGVAVELVEAGISNESIVLAFHPPYVRQHTDFAIG